MELFKELTGADWFAKDYVEFDKETKITEFDYENYLHPDLLSRIDTSTPEFKNLVKHLNFNTKTQYEKHKIAQEKFSKFMGLISCLNDEEKRAFIHLVKNRHGGCAPGEELTE